MDRFHECFGDIADPRAGNAQYDLVEILFVALLAVLCGAKNCSDMAEFGRAKEGLLRTVLTLGNGIPSHDTFSRVFRMLDPAGFEAAFRRFMASFAKAGGVAAIDGKSLRGAYERGKSFTPRMMITLWGAQTRMSLANTEAQGGNERQAALDLLAMVQLKGLVVTADALHGNRDMARIIKERGGDYVLAVKDNQPALMKGIEDGLASGAGAKSAGVAEKAHDREETRTVTIVPAPHLAVMHDFPGLAAIARIEYRRGDGDPLVRTFILSKRFTPEKLLEIVRAHWGIENTLHWTLDVVLDEDLARNRKDNGPANLAVLRRLALNIAKAHPDTKTSLRRKLLRAGWDDNFLFDLIRHMR